MTDDNLSLLLADCARAGVALRCGPNRIELTAADDEVITAFSSRLKAVKLDLLRYLNVIEDGYWFAPLTAVQQSIYNQSRNSQATTPSQVSYTLTIDGPVNVGALERAILDVVQLHDALRARVSEACGIPFFWIDPTVLAEVRRDVVATDSNCWGEEALRDERALERTDDIALGDVPLFRITLSNEGKEVSIHFQYHHIICDGWSTSIFDRAVSERYKQNLKGVIEPLTPPPCFAVANVAKIAREQSQDRAALSLFWKTHLAGIPANDDMSFGDGKRLRSKKQVVTARADIAPALLRKVRAYAAERGVGPAAIFLTAFALSQLKLSPSDIINIGVPFNGRTVAETEAVFGCYVTLLPVQLKLPLGQQFDKLVAITNRRLQEVSAHQDTSLLQVMENMGAENRNDGSLLLNSVFAYHGDMADGFSLPGCTVIREALPTVRDMSCLFASVHASLDRCSVQLQSSSAIHSAESLSFTLDTLKHILRQIATVEEPAALKHLMTSAERDIIEGCGRSEEAYPFLPFPDAFQRAALLHAESTAVCWRKTTLTHKQMLLFARCIEKQMQAAGVSAGSRVGVFMYISPAQIAAVIAVMTLGAVFVPLDPEWPSDRLRDVCAAANLDFIFADSDRIDTDLPRNITFIGQADHYDELSGEETRSKVRLDPTDTAYIIFTSGSSGKPKGVEVSHRSLSNLFQGEIERFSVRADDRVLLVAPFIFDPWICHVTLTLAAGATLVQIPRPKDCLGENLVETLDRENITHAFLAAAVLDQLPVAELPALRVLASAGDHCSPDVITRWAYNRRLFNIYGPTEATVNTTFKELLPATNLISIGRPIKGAYIRVLNSALVPVPIGYPGELCIGGCGLAKGYINNEDLNDQSFIEDPLKPDARLYRTGDMARLLPDGDIQLLGRIDHQIKVRGYRVDPAEVERALVAIPEVSAVAVVPERGHDERTLLNAYYVCAHGSEITASELRKKLSRAIPGYMVPARCTSLASMPLTEGGKIDRKRLVAYASQENRTPPPSDVTASEAAVLNAWREALPEIEISIDSDFFKSGGDSLSAVFAARVSKTTSFPFSLSELYEHSVLKKLAAFVSQKNGIIETSSAVHTAPLSPAQRWFFSLELNNRNHWNQSAVVKGTPETSVLDVQAALEALIRHVPALRTSFGEDGSGRLCQKVRSADSFATPQVSQLDVSENIADDEIREFLLNAHNEIDFSSGPVATARLVNYPDEQYVYLVAHHLAVDELSWDTLKDQFSTLLDDPTLTIEEDYSFLHWCKSVEKTFQDASESEVSRLLADHVKSASTNRQRRLSNRGYSIDEVEANFEVTPGFGSLLNAFGGLRVQDAIIWAVDKALQSATEWSSRVIELERNGRGLANAGCDTSSSVGWFTVNQPLPIWWVSHGPPIRDLVILAQHTKQCEEVLPFLTKSEWESASPCRAAEPDISVNYKEEAKASTSCRTDFGSPLESFQGLSIAANNPLPRPLTMSIERKGNQFQCQLLFDTEVWSRAAAGALLQMTKEWLQSLGRDLQKMSRRQGFVSIPATYMQTLMLDTQEAHADLDVYIGQQVSELPANVPMDVKSLAERVRFLCRTHSAFNTVFRCTTEGEWVQEVGYDLEANVSIIDLSKISSADALPAIKNIAASHRKMVRARGKGPLYRWAIISLPNNRFAISITAHHALLDGWSVKTLIGELLDPCSGAISEETSVSLPPALFHGAYERLVELTMSTETPRHQTFRKAYHFGGSALTTQATIGPDIVDGLLDYCVTRSLNIRATLLWCTYQAERHLGENMGRSMAVVSSGRGEHLPEPSHDVGMFWYFLPVNFSQIDISSPLGIAQIQEKIECPASKLYKLIKADATSTLTSAHSSFNYVAYPETASPREKLRGLIEHDRFHFPINYAIARERSSIALSIQSRELSEAKLSMLRDAILSRWSDLARRT